MKQLLICIVVLFNIHVKSQNEVRNYSFENNTYAPNCGNSPTPGSSGNNQNSLEDNVRRQYNDAVSFDILNKYFWALNYEKSLNKVDTTNKFSKRLCFGIGTEPFMHQFTYIPTTFKLTSTSGLNSKIGFELEIGLLSQFNHNPNYKNKDFFINGTPYYDLTVYKHFFEISFFSSFGIRIFNTNKTSMYLKGSITTHYSLYYKKFDLILPWGGLTLKYNLT